MLRSVEAALGAGHATLVRYCATSDPAFDSAMATVDHVPGWFGEVNAAVFWAVIGELRPSVVLEIGSYLGRSTVLIGLALEHFCKGGARLVSIDPHTGDRQQLAALGLDAINTADLFALHIAGSGVAHVVEAKTMTSDEASADWTDAIDLLFVDGWHSYEAVRADIRHFATRLGPNGSVCFDDFDYPDVGRAVTDGCREASLTLYGTVVGQAWAGRVGKGPAALRRSIRCWELW